MSDRGSDASYMSEGSGAGDVEAMEVDDVVPKKRDTKGKKKAVEKGKKKSKRSEDSEVLESIDDSTVYTAQSSSTLSETLNYFLDDLEEFAEGEAATKLDARQKAIEKAHTPFETWLTATKKYQDLNKPVVQKLNEVEASLVERGYKGEFLKSILATAQTRRHQREDGIEDMKRAQEKYNGNTEQSSSDD
ncbi:hypothetical protein DL93DRAFT_2171872 [Clavulina sp. PMI_390]|nr:hypothetical protein DL93DRAFT_2171872 [Clavulina sp. PMI_390]